MGTSAGKWALSGGLPAQDRGAARTQLSDLGRPDNATQARKVQETRRFTVIGGAGVALMSHKNNADQRQGRATSKAMVNRSPARNGTVPCHMVAGNSAIVPAIGATSR